MHIAVDMAVGCQYNNPKMNDANEKIRFVGNQDDGYIAEFSSTVGTCHVRKSGKTWTATIAKRFVDGIRDVSVGAQFNSRKAAALAGRDAYRLEWR